MEPKKALEKIARLHAPSVAVAYVKESLYGPGRCAYCDNAELVKALKTVHYHVDPFPVCTSCSHGYESTHPYPCATAKVLERVTR